MSIHFVVESGRTAPGVAVRVPGGFRFLDPDPGFRQSRDQELFCGGAPEQHAVAGTRSRSVSRRSRPVSSLGAPRDERLSSMAT